MDLSAVECRSGCRAAPQSSRWAYRLAGSRCRPPDVGGSSARQGEQLTNRTHETWDAGTAIAEEEDTRQHCWKPEHDVAPHPHLRSNSQGTPRLLRATTASSARLTICLLTHNTHSTANAPVDAVRPATAHPHQPLFPTSYRRARVCSHCCVACGSCWFQASRASVSCANGRGHSLRISGGDSAESDVHKRAWLLIQTSTYMA